MLRGVLANMWSGAKTFQNKSNVHVCSLARASIARHLCCRSKYKKDLNVLNYIVLFNITDNNLFKSVMVSPKSEES